MRANSAARKRTAVRAKDTRYAAVLECPDEEPFHEYLFPDQDRGLRTLSRVNFFVGRMNSGKSRFLRSLFFTQKPLRARPDLHTITRLCEIVRPLSAHYDAFLEVFSKYGGSKSNAFPHRTLKNVMEQRHDPDSASTGDVNAFHQVVARIQEEEFKNKFRAENSTKETLLKYEELKDHAAVVQGTIEENALVGELDLSRRIYVPMLRGLRAIADTDSDPYLVRTRKDYFPSWKEGDAGAEREIFTGQRLYTSLRTHLLGTREQRDRVRGFEVFLGSSFFEGRQVSLVPREGDDSIHIQVGDSHELPMPSVGDGIQSLIILTYPMFVEEKALFFIEEPELSLHPGLQRILIQVMSRFPAHQFFCTTHSNHFLDMALDFDEVSIFRISRLSKPEKKKVFKIEFVEGVERGILEDLGVRTSSVFLANASIWVEGVTDRLYLREYLARYRDELPENHRWRQFKEDVHYVFVEYQGSCLEHWCFGGEGGGETARAERTCATALVIADGDVRTKGDRDERFSRVLGDRWIVLSVKEMENLLDSRVIRSVVGEHRGASKLDTSSIEEAGYRLPEMGLGKYLDQVLKAGEDGKKPLFSADSGTIKDKLSFCRKATRIMREKNVEWALPEETKGICKRIFEHIESLNG